MGGWSWGWGQKCRKNDPPPPFVVSEIMNLLGFFGFEPQKCFWVPTPWVCMGRSATSVHAVYALFSHFCFVGGFGDLGDPVLPTLRGASGDVVTVYTYWHAKGRFFAVCSLAEGRSKPMPKKRNDCFHQ